MFPAGSEIDVIVGPSAADALTPGPARARQPTCRVLPLLFDPCFAV